MEDQIPHREFPARPTIVIGAGAAGLAVARELKQSGIPFKVIEMHDEIGGLWNIHNEESPAYLSLATNSSKTTTYLDTNPPRSWPSYLSLDQARRYLDDFAQRHQLLPHILFHCCVRAVEAGNRDQWTVRFTERSTGKEDSLMARAVVLCTGMHRRQNRYIPGELLGAVGSSDIGYIHSSDYRDSAPYIGKRVVVVGFGNSAADIATEISEVCRTTTISCRSVPWIIPLWAIGLPADLVRRLAVRMHIPFAIQKSVFHFLQRVYIGHPNRLGLGPVNHDLLDRLPVSDRGLMKAVNRGRVRLRGPVRSIGRHTVRFTEDREIDEPVDNIIFATGYNKTYPVLDRQLAEPLSRDDQPFPFFIFHPVENNLFFTSEVSVPQGSWPMFAEQARVIAAYLRADSRPGNNFRSFNNDREAHHFDFKGRLFRCADRFHVDPDIYAGHLRRFTHWITR